MSASTSQEPGDPAPPRYIEGATPSPRRSVLDRWLRLPFASLLLGGALLYALLGREEAPKPPPPDVALPPAPFVLLATDVVSDGVFDDAVILVFRHGPQGAAGFVIGRRGAAGLPPPGELAVGGPVDPDKLRVLSRRALPGSERVTTGLHVLLHPELAEAALELAGDDVRHFRGYAGWSGGQLEGEVAMGAWDVAPFDLERVFPAR